MNAGCRSTFDACIKDAGCCGNVRRRLLHPHLLHNLNHLHLELHHAITACMLLQPTGHTTAGRGLCVRVSVLSRCHHTHGLPPATSHQTVLLFCKRHVCRRPQHTGPLLMTPAMPRLQQVVVAAPGLLCWRACLGWTGCCLCASYWLWWSVCSWALSCLRWAHVSDVSQHAL